MLTTLAFFHYSSYILFIELSHKDLPGCYLCEGDFCIGAVKVLQDSLQSVQERSLNVV